MNTKKRSVVLAIVVIIMALSLVTAGSITASALAVKKNTIDKKSTSNKKTKKTKKGAGTPSTTTPLKNFFDCVSKTALNGKPTKVNVDRCFDIFIGAPTAGPNATGIGSIGSAGASAAATAGR
jgi:hypothetical protein